MLHYCSSEGASANMGRQSHLTRLALVRYSLSRAEIRRTIPLTESQHFSYFQKMMRNFHLLLILGFRDGLHSILLYWTSMATSYWDQTSTMTQHETMFRTSTAEAILETLLPTYQGEDYYALRMKLSPLSALSFAMLKRSVLRGKPRPMRRNLRKLSTRMRMELISGSLRVSYKGCRRTGSSISGDAF